ncbi:MAG TPA: ABC transporter ATP-binding protein [Acidimicrobiia bacterium]|nr:ABC transporter ATP-binding protein [Acidimicrobiia bacterium]
MITIDHLTKTYGPTTVVDDMSLTVPDGAAWAFWGPNGAGKTTVIRCILGLVAYDGAITVEGMDARSRGKAVRSIIGYVPQELAFYDDMAVVDLLDYSAALRGLGPDRVEQVAGAVDLDGHKDKKVSELSGGLKQRLGIASALIPDPPILLLDEPTSNLDAHARDSVIELLISLRNEGRTLLITSHHADEVGMLVDSVVAMDQGRITTICRPEDLSEEVGLKAWMQLILANGSADHALEVLDRSGFVARRNTGGILVEVAAQRKAAALDALHVAGIRIDDLEVWR